MIPCGGESTRLGTGKNKCVEGKITTLEIVVEFWKRRGITHFIFIVGGDTASIVGDRARSLTPNAIVIDRRSTLNLGMAIYMIREMVLDRFIVALGDCVNFGEFLVPIDVDFGVGACIATKEETQKNYLVIPSPNGVSGLVEKPKSVVGLCGMGTFFLHKRIFEYIKRLHLEAKATSVDLTGALQLAIGSGEIVSPIYFKGEYVNVTDASDIKKVQRLARIMGV